MSEKEDSIKLEKRNHYLSGWNRGFLIGFTIGISSVIPTIITLIIVLWGR